MTARFKYQWFLFAAVWIGCFTICYLNIDTVTRILDNREKKEILRKDYLFWKQSTKNIDSAIEQKKLLSHETESLKLGMVFLNDMLNKTGKKFSLEKLKTDMDSKQCTGESMPVKIAFSGGLKNGLDAIKNLQTDYPFLSFDRVKIENGFIKNKYKFELQLNYKYNITFTN